MEQKIQELTEKIYREGVAKGEEKAQQVIKEAEEKAKAILADAKAQAERTAADAQRQAEELKRNTESELKLSGSQALAALKQQITELVLAKVIDDAAIKTLSDVSVLKEFIDTAIRNWKGSAGELPTLEIMLPEAKKIELGKSFEKGTSDLLKHGVQVIWARNIKSGFRIGPAGGSFKISFTDEDFREFFKDYLRPRTRSYLFGE